MRGRFEDDFDFGKANIEGLRLATDYEDRKQGIDYRLDNIPLAWRKRDFSINKYREISVRYARFSGFETEHSKLMSDKIKALYYVTEFSDAYVIHRVSDIKNYFQNTPENKLTLIPNPDNETEGCYIPIDSLPHVIIKRGG